MRDRQPSMIDQHGADSHPPAEPTRQTLTRNATVRANDDAALRMYLDEIGAVALLSQEQVVRLAQRIERSTADGQQARKELIEANLRLVVSVAKKYAGYDMPLLDLIQEGNLGLMRAVDKYDWRHGAAFPTYAYYWIRQSIVRAMLNQGRMVRLPVHMGEQVIRLRRLSRTLEQSLLRPPTMDELASASGLSMRRVRSVLAADVWPVSLEQKADPDGDTSLRDSVPGRSDDEPMEVFAEDQLYRHVHAALRTLPEPERSVLLLRYGFRDGKRRSHDEIGSVFGVTREHVRQLEAAALRCLRLHAAMRLLEGF